MRTRGAPSRTPKKEPAGAFDAGARLIHVRLTEAIHRALRIHVATHDTSIQDWVAELIERELATAKADRFAGEGAQRR